MRTETDIKALKARLPHGSVQRIADSLGMTYSRVNYALTSKPTHRKGWCNSIREDREKVYTAAETLLDNLA